MQTILIAIVFIVAAALLGVTVYEKGTTVNIPGTTAKQPENTQTGNEAEETLDAPHLLDSSGKGLEKVPSYIFERTDLESLDLSHNALTGAIPGEIRFLKNLRVLDLSDNQMTGLPAELGQLGALETLDVSNNKLTGLPLELGNLTKLKVLNLSGNDYSEYDLNIIKQKLIGTNIITE